MNPAQTQEARSAWHTACQTSCPSSSLWLPNCPLTTVRNYHGAGPAAAAPTDQGSSPRDAPCCDTETDLSPILNSLSPRKPLSL